MALQTPSPTLYVSNLEPKTKKPELRQQLYALFTPYGKVIDIVAKKHNGGRGQAFVVFAEQAAATAAMRGLSGEPFYERDLRISYAKSASHATLALTDPTASREAAAIKAAKMTVSNAAGEYEQLEKEREAEEQGRAAEVEGQSSSAVAAGEKRPNENGDDVDGGVGAGRAGKKSRTDNGPNGGANAAEEDEMEIEMEDDDDALPKGTTLICTNLPPECNADIMAALFSQHAGYQKALPLPSSASVPSSHPKPNEGAKSFRVVFTTTDQASKAAESNKGFTMQPGWDMGVSVQ